MAGTKKPRKAYRPKYAGDHVKLKHEPWKVRAVFAPLEAIVDQFEQHGTVDVAGAKDTPVFKDQNDGAWYDTTAALLGVVDAYEIHEIRTGRPLNLVPLRQLANKLQYGMPIFDADTKAVRACLGRMHAATLEMTFGYARDLVNDFRIKEELQKVAA